jgi:hypothetical protein
MVQNQEANQEIEVKLKSIEGGILMEVWHQKGSLHILFTITIAIWWIINGLALAEDLTVEGPLVLEGGDYENILVINNGNLTINGDITAQAIILRWGQITSKGNLSAKSFLMESSEEEPSQLHVCGRWFVDDVKITKGVRVVYIIPYKSSIVGSGQFFLECDTFVLGSEAIIDANAAGGDRRGAGTGSSGGGYGGKGGSSNGQGGSTYGSVFSPTIEMGSPAGDGALGGGSISIIAAGDVAVHGTITTNGFPGRHNDGGGSGGGVLIECQHLDLTGFITANGENYASGWGGGGGGGRIKLFYSTGFNINDTLGNLSVKGGKGALSPSGEKGTIWTNVYPSIPELLIPENGALLPTQRPTFRFEVMDTSVATDNRDDDLSCIIELSMDNFETLHRVYNQKVSLEGWSDFSYKSGDEAEFTPTEDLQKGVYQWRAAIQDRSNRGESSEVRTFILLNLDVNQDESIDVIDLVLVGQHFGDKGDGIIADINDDGIVDILDLVLVGNFFEQSVSQ